VDKAAGGKAAGQGCNAKSKYNDNNNNNNNKAKARPGRVLTRVKN
jgi:hypothetical protein